jgi:hypothetical protein
MQPIYVELGDEVTTIIERIGESEEGSLALVVPKGAVVLQSIVNLKLIRKAAADHGKELVLVTTDKIGRNLAEQIGLTAFSKFDPNQMEEGKEDIDPVTNEPRVIAGVKIHRYYDEENDLAENEEENAIEPIIPKQLLRNEQPTKNTPTKEESSDKIEGEIRTSISPAESETPPETVGETIPEKSPQNTPGKVVEEVTAPVVEAAPLNRVEAPMATNENVAPDGEPTITRKNFKAVDKGANPHLAKNWRRSWVSYGIFLLCLILVAGTGLAFTFLPKSTLAITIPADKWEKTLTITTKPVGQTAAANEVSVLALSAELTDTLTAKATGTKETGNKATGSTRLYNDLGTTTSLPAGARILANGQYFTTNVDATIPAATAKVESDGSIVKIPGSTTVAITAEAPGPSSNLGDTAGTIVAPTTQAYARIVSTTGGTSNLVGVVTQADIDTAKAGLTKQLQDKLHDQLTTQSQGHDYIYDPTADIFTLDSFTASVQANTQADTVQVSAKGTMKRLVIDRDAVKNAANSQIQKENTPNNELVLQTVTLATVSIVADKDSTIRVTANGTSHPLVSSATILAKLAGHNSSEAIAIAQGLATNARGTVTFQPSWWPRQRFPLSTKFVTIKIVYE